MTDDVKNVLLKQKMVREKQDFQLFLAGVAITIFFLVLPAILSL